MDNKIKNCCFIGHRNTILTDEQKINLKNNIEYLIKNDNLINFLFGSKSKFNYECYKIITELKCKYPDLKRIFYTCKNESCIFEKNYKFNEKLKLKLANYVTEFCVFDEEYEHNSKYTAGKASYIERNYAMINNSDYCVFYYDKDSYTNTTSGTKIAYNYALKNRKNIINIFLQNKNS